MKLDRELQLLFARVHGSVGDAYEFEFEAGSLGEAAGLDAGGDVELTAATRATIDNTNGIIRKI